MTKNKVVVLIAIVVALSVVWFSGVLSLPVVTPEITPENANFPSDGEASSEPSGDSQVGFAKLGPNAIYVADQMPGNKLLINIVNIQDPGYVVIHESKNGVPGAIIGHSSLIENTANKFAVTLNRPGKDGEELIAMLHIEKGGMGFDPKIDVPVLDESGSSIHMIFMIDSNSSPSESEIVF